MRNNTKGCEPLHKARGILVFQEWSNRASNYPDKDCVKDILITERGDYEDVFAIQKVH